MRGRVLILGLAGLLMLGVGQIPGALLSTLPSVEYVRPKERVLEEELTCIGVVYAEKEVEIYLDSPVIADEVTVAVGDEVSADALLAKIDLEKTKSVLAEGATVELPGSAVISQYEDLARSITSGTLAGVDYGALFEEYQSTFGAVTEETQVLLLPEITAPIDGVVTKVGLREKFLTRLSEPAFVISDLSSCKVLATVAQSDMDKVAVGDGATITGSGLGEERFFGVVSKIYPTAKRVYSGTVQEAMVEVEITLEGSYPTLRPGYSVTAKIHHGTGAPAITLPYEAVEQDGENVEYVYLLTPDCQIVRQDVTTGKELLGSVEITEGLSPADTVIYQPGRVTDPGAPVYLKGEAAVD